MYVCLGNLGFSVSLRDVDARFANLWFLFFFGDPRDVGVRVRNPVFPCVFCNTGVELFFSQEPEYRVFFLLQEVERSNDIAHARRIF